MTRITFVTIFISDPSFFRRLWLKRAAKKIGAQCDTTMDCIRTCKTLCEVEQKISSSKTNNLYFLHADLNSEKDLADLKKIREKDCFGRIVLFVENVENLEVLFERGLTVLDYQKINSPKQEQIEKVEDIYKHLFFKKTEQV